MIDAIIPAFGNPDITFRCIASLRLFAPKGTRIILIDNGSPDDGVPALKHHVDKYIRLDPNRGPYGAVNAGLDAATQEYVAIVCNDVVVLPMTFQNMLSMLAPERPIIGANGILLPEFDYYTASAYAAWAGMQSPQLFPGVCFTCCLAYRWLYAKVGRFDERFKITFGDTDFEQRVADAGHPYLIAQNAPIYHGHGVTRKRGGFEKDLRDDAADHAAFLEKWKDRPDVCARHPLEDPERKREAQLRSHARGER